MYFVFIVWSVHIQYQNYPPSHPPFLFSTDACLPSLRQSPGGVRHMGRTLSTSPWRRPQEPEALPSKVRTRMHTPCTKGPSPGASLKRTSTRCADGPAISPLSAVSSVSSVCSPRLYDRGHRVRMCGQLQLSISVHQTTLRVHLESAKHLITQGVVAPKHYVQVTLSPASCERPWSVGTFVTGICRSGVPVFQESFDVPAPAVPFKQRLVVSVMHMRGPHSHLVGCMSFGVRHLMKHRRTVSGWYYLMDQHLGMRKHLRVNTSYGHFVDSVLDQSKNATARSSRLSVGPSRMKIHDDRFRRSVVRACGVTSSEDELAGNSSCFMRMPRIDNDVTVGHCTSSGFTHASSCSEQLPSNLYDTSGGMSSVERARSNHHHSRLSLRPALIGSDISRVSSDSSVSRGVLSDSADSRISISEVLRLSHSRTIVTDVWWLTTNAPNASQEL